MSFLPGRLAARLHRFALPWAGMFMPRWGETCNSKLLRRIDVVKLFLASCLSLVLMKQDVAIRKCFLEFVISSFRHAGIDKSQLLQRSKILQCSNSGVGDSKIPTQAEISKSLQSRQLEDSRIGNLVSANLKRFETRHSAAQLETVI